MEDILYKHVIPEEEKFWNQPEDGLFYDQAEGSDSNDSDSEEEDE